MPIRFRCIHCGQLSAISHRMAGQDVACPTCGQSTPVVDVHAQLQPAKSSARIAFDTDVESGGFVFRRRTSEFEDMDLTPMVDVTFLLLIFFMITASFSLQKTLAFPPPNPDNKGARQTLQTLDDFKQHSLIVEIDANNAIYIDDVPLADSNGLSEALRETSRTSQKFEVLIDAHPSALHETVVKVVDAANDVGLQKIRLAATRSADSG